MRTSHASAHDRAANRRRHVSLHRHRGLDAARQTAARSVHRGTRRSPAAATDGLRQHGGHQLDTEGDSFFVAFSSAREAVLAAVESQLSLAPHGWPEGVRSRFEWAFTPVRRWARGPVHGACGPPRRTHLRGRPRRTGPRLAGDPNAARGGGGSPAVSLRDLGEHRLKDLDRPVPSVPGGRGGAACVVPTGSR